MKIDTVYIPKFNDEQKIDLIKAYIKTEDEYNIEIFVAPNQLPAFLHKECFLLFNNETNYETVKSKIREHSKVESEQFTHYKYIKKILIEH